MMRGLQGLITLSFVCLSSVVYAQSGTINSSLRGWTATGNEIVVEQEHLGQIMVDDASREYYFETSSTYRSKDGSLLQSYRRGEATGAAHPDFEAAREQRQFKKFLETAGLLLANESWLSPDGKWLLSAVESRGFGQETRCELHQRVMLFNPAEQKVHVVFEQSTRGETSSSRDIGTCPQARLKAFWHPNSTQWVIEREQTRPDRGWRLHPGRIDNLDGYADSEFISNEFSRQIVLSELEEGSVREAWSLAFEGQLPRALQVIANDPKGSPGKVLLMALLFAKDGKAAPAKKLLKDEAQALKSTSLYETGLQAAVLAAAGDKSGATRILSNVTKQASSWKELARLAAVFSIVDLNVSNELFVHALSHSSAAEQDTTLAYSAMLEGLIEARQFEAAETIFAKLGVLNSAQRVLQASLWVAQGRLQFARPVLDQILLAEPGRCRAYAVSARLATAERRVSEALELYRAANVCNPMLTDAAFFVADLELRRGDIERGRQYLEGFLRHTGARQMDPVRDLRLKWAAQSLKRLSQKGAVLLTASCFPSGSQTLCQGTVLNTTDAPLEGILATVWSKDKRARLVELGKSEVPSLAPGESATITVMVDSVPAAMSVGRSKAESDLNQVEIL